MISISIVLALPDESLNLPLVLEDNSTVGMAIKIAKADPVFRDIDLDAYKIGIYGELCVLEDVLSHGDRIEFYRPIKADPKAQRRKRALEQASSLKDESVGLSKD